MVFQGPHAHAEEIRLTAHPQTGVQPTAERPSPSVRRLAESLVAVTASGHPLFSLNTA
jgi:hypothetical protein